MNFKTNVRPHFGWSFTGALLLLLLFCGQVAHAQQLTRQRNFDVLHYTARIDPDLSEETLRGRETISLLLLDAGVREVGFDAGTLVVDEVRQQGRKLSFEKLGTRLTIQLVGDLVANQHLDIEIKYHGAPRFGMEFHPEVGQLFTIFSTSQWLVCVDAPDERATLDLSVALPGGLKVAGNGRLVSERSLRSNRTLYHWQQNEPVSSFVYGFAAGRFNEVNARANGVDLRFLSQDLQPDQLRELFADTGDMLKFFGNRAGIPYRGTYNQALVTRTIGQEMAGLALMSEAYGRKTLANPTDEDLIAHEAAHQWWGITVTCRSWSDFWLNEGFANFMAAAYIEHRFGDSAYKAIVERWQRTVDHLVETGKDHPLVYQQWLHPTRDDRAVVYRKGAYVLYLLRGELGENKFWKGIRDYTQEFNGKSVTTADFKGAMERSSGRSLDSFFQRWVTGSTSNSVAPAVSVNKKMTGTNRPSKTALDTGPALSQDVAIFDAFRETSLPHDFAVGDGTSWPLTDRWLPFDDPSTGE